MGVLRQQKLARLTIISHNGSTCEKFLNPQSHLKTKTVLHRCILRPVPGLGSIGITAFILQMKKVGCTAGTRNLPRVTVSKWQRCGGYRPKLLAPAPADTGTNSRKLLSGYD